LWFLSELYEQNIFNFKVEKIIQRLTEPLSNESNLPKLQSNRLLLALALTKLQTTVKSSNYRTVEQSSNSQTIVKQSSNSRTTVKPSNFRTIIEPSNSRTLEQSSNSQTIVKQLSNLLTEINRNTIKSELPLHNTTLRYGIPGIAWVYHQLHRLTGDNHFKKEMEYWRQLPFESEKSNEIFPGFNNESLNAWGLLEGLAGILVNK
jgi:hypothetical protein